MNSHAVCTPNAFSCALNDLYHHWRPFSTLLLIACSITACLLSSCSRAAVVSQDDYNFMVVADKEFIKKKSDYKWWPSNEETILSGRPSSLGGGSWSSGGDGREVLAAAAVLIAVILVAEAADVSYHHLHGMNISFLITGSVIHQSFPLDWGINRFKVPEAALSALESGKAHLYIVSTGTRRVRILLPTDGMKIKRDVHILEFTDSGNIIVNGDRVKPNQISP